MDSLNLGGFRAESETGGAEECGTGAEAVAGTRDVLPPFCAV